jgi:cytochrome P450
MDAPRIEIDLGSPAHKAAPYETFGRMRHDMPVVRVPLKGRTAVQREAYVVSRYADVSALLKDKRLVKDPVNAGLAPLPTPSFLRPLTRNMLGMDDPDHARLKRLVMATFVPRRIALMRQRAEEISAELLDRAADKGAFDLIEDYAMPLPVRVISDLLGVPSADQARFARWSSDVIRIGGPSLGALLALPGLVFFLRYLRKLVAAKRRDPADDLVSALVAAETAGDKLSGEELLAMISILLSAGHETTVNLIGNGMLTLLDHPEVMADLRLHPDKASGAVEELLRFASPVAMTTHRFAADEVTFADVTIPKGSLVFGALASANRDETQFTNADRLDIARDPNRHLTFGEGGHYCVGASLARMEGAVAFRDLTQRFPNIRLAGDPASLKWNHNLILSGLHALPVTV